MEFTNLTNEFALASVLSREEHLAACKARALAVARAGQLAEAMTLFLTGMWRHPGTSVHESLGRGVRMFANRELNTPEAMQRFLEEIH